MSVYLDRYPSTYPLVTVIIPAYNAERFIEKTLKSVLNQTYDHTEVIVVDDGSQDRTAEIVRSLAKTDNRIKFFQQQNQGVAAARNLAIAQARGEYIAPIDADDIWFPNKLQKQVEWFQNSSEEVGVIYTWSIFINEDDSLGHVCQVSDYEGDIYIPLIYGNLLGNASTPLIRRGCFEQVGGYDSSFWHQKAQGCEDWDLYLRIAERYQFRVVPELLVGYRQVQGSMSFDHLAMQRSCDLLFESVRGYHPEIPDTLFRWSQSTFSWYLGKRCQQCGDHWSSVQYFLQAAQLDFLPLVRPGFYLSLVNSLMRAMLPGIRQLKRSLPANLFHRSSIAGTSSSVEEMYTSPGLQTARLRKYEQFPRKQYSDFVLWRCLQIQKRTPSFVRHAGQLKGDRKLSSSV